MSTIIVRHLFPALLFLMASLPLAAQPLDGTDPFHPRRFVDIVECESSAGGCLRPRALIEPDSSSQAERVSAEVDIDSKILIRFDREVLFARSEQLVREGVGAFEAAIEISARIGDRPVEVPGYFETGEEAATAVAVVRSGGELFSAVTTLGRLLSRFSDEDLRALALTEADFRLPDDDTVETPEIRRLSQRLADARQRAAQARTEADALLSDYNLTSDEQLTSVIAGLESREADIRAASDSAALANAVAERNRYAARYGFSGSAEEANQLRARIEGLRASVTSAEAEVDDLDRTLDREADDEARRAQAMRTRVRENRILVERLRRKALNGQSRAIALFDLLLDPANAFLIRAYAEQGTPPENPRALIAAASTLRDALTRLDSGGAPQEPADFVAALAFLNTVYQSLLDLRPPDGTLTPEMERRLRRRLLYQLADTAISPRAADARPGDVLTITIVNRAAGQAVPRTLTVRLTLNDFGLIREVTDSFFLLNRDGVAPTSAQALSDDGIERAREVEFEPTPGASLTWTWHPRRQQDWKRPFADFFRFLRPGIGLNVSFPRFGLIERETVGDATGDVAVVTENQGLDVAAGGVLTFFDNALAFTIGQALTSRLDAVSSTEAEALRGGDAAVMKQGSNWYVGVGFSFVGVADKLGR